MDDMLVEKMLDYMESKSTEELVQIWRQNDRTKYPEEAFEAIRQIFEERGEKIPSQLPIRKTLPIRRGEEIESERGGFFSFRTMISPIAIKIIYVLGMLGLTSGGIVMIVMGLDLMGSGAEKLNIFGSQTPFNKQILIGIALIVLGNLVWRFLCESWILLFRICDILGSIERQLKRGSGVP
ncbi:MAG: DUF4282 domain-containing protein [Candidatus Hodarchaeota archaeon]